MSTTYKAIAHREGDWWVIDVDGIGATQTKRLDQADGTARDLIATMLDMDPGDVHVDITPEVGPELDGLVLSARTAADAAKEAQAKATETSRTTAERLHAAGYPMRDIGILTGVSYQRIHQLLDAKKRNAAARSDTVKHAPGAEVEVAKSPKVGTRVRKGSPRAQVDA